MNTSKEREALKAYRNNAKWRRKVDEMPDDQVIAILIRLRSQKPAA